MTVVLNSSALVSIHSATPQTASFYVDVFG